MLHQYSNTNINISQSTVATWVRLTSGKICIDHFIANILLNMCDDKIIWLK